jgi:integrase
MITGHLEQARASNGKPYWRIRLDYGPDQITGKRSQPRLPGRYADERTAKRKMAEVVHEANHGPRIVPSKRTVQAVVNDWLDNEASVSVREKTIRDYRSVCKLHVIPHVGHIPVQELTTASVQAFRAKLLAAGHSHFVAGKATLHLHQAMAYAVRQGYLSHNPAGNLRRLKAPRREMKVWTAEQAAAFLTVAGDATYNPLWLIALSTGMRLGELRGLGWQDIDWARSVLSVRRSIDQYSTENDPKSGSARTIDLDATCLQALKELRARQNPDRLKLGEAWKHADLVFASSSGNYLQARSIYRVKERLESASGVPAIRFHDLRHTAATLMLQAGIPVKVVSERLGHANATITLNLYAHVLPNMQRAAADMLGLVLAGRGPLAPDLHQLANS